MWYLLWDAPPRTSRRNTLDHGIRVLSAAEAPSAGGSTGRRQRLPARWSHQPWRFPFAWVSEGGVEVAVVGRISSRVHAVLVLCLVRGFRAVRVFQVSGPYLQPLGLGEAGRCWAWP